MVSDPTGMLPDEEEARRQAGGEPDEPQLVEKKPRGDTARTLTILLVWILAGSVGIHFLATAIFSAFGNTSAVEALASIFHMWLPVISALASAAATYYFTREDRT